MFAAATPCAVGARILAEDLPRCARSTGSTSCASTTRTAGRRSLQLLVESERASGEIVGGYV